MGRVVAVSISEKKGMRKTNVPRALAIENFGFEGDAHASSSWHRQVSLLAAESIEKMVKAGLDVKAGDFAGVLGSVAEPGGGGRVVDIGPAGQFADQRDQEQEGADVR